MVTFIILLNVKRGAVTETAEKLVEMGSVTEVYSVTGKYDLVALVRTKSNDDVAELVTHQLSTIDAIEKTDTMLAFNTYSQHDLESMFSM
ncbi:MAG: Lrp/AsnC ligand binding domain-containing protein [Pseudomonadota bacterium]